MSPESMRPARFELATSRSGGVPRNDKNGTLEPFSRDACQRITGDIGPDRGVLANALPLLSSPVDADPAGRVGSSPFVGTVFHVASSARH